MKRLSLFGLALLISFLSFSQGLMWVKHFTGTGANQPYATIRDNAGNYYVYGNFNGNVVQDALSLDSYGGSQDIFLSKYNSSGEIQWLKQIGGVGTESAYGLCLSSDGNYVYVSGTFNNTCGVEGTYLNNTGSNDIFLAKFQTDGTLTWAYNAAYGSYNHQNGSIAVDSDGNIIMVGVFYSSVIFYGGAGQLNYGDPLLRQHFMAKFDGSGNLVWSKLIEGDNSGTYVRSVSAYNNEYYFSGQYIGLLKIGASSVTNSTSYRDGFVFKTNSTGDCQWIRRIEGPDNNEFIINNKTDNSGNVLLAGYFNSARLRIDSTATDTSRLNYVNVRSGRSDIVFMKFSSGGTFQWAKTAGTDQDDRAIDISAYNDKIVVTGSFQGSIWFDNINLVNKSGPDAFIVECTTTGEYTAGYKVSGNASDIGETCVMSTNERNFLATGDSYSDTITVETYNFVNPDILKRDAYIARYGCFDGVSVSGTNVTCFGLADGTATANPASGSGPYTYLWSNDSTTATINGLSAGTYNVTVTGANNCSATASVTITQPNVLTSDSSQTNVSCYGGNNGTATVIPIGGTPSYTYLWSDNQTTVTAIDLVAGVYSVTVYDANNCTTTNSVSITEPAVLSATTTQNNGCNGVCNKSATAVPFGGTAPLTYLWDNAQTTVTSTGLCAGTFYVTVTDACNNTTTSSVTITEPAVLTITPSQVEPGINLCNGTATSTPSGGTSPYTFLWSNAQTTNTATGICGGICAVTVTDANGCTTSGSYTFKKATNLAVFGTPTATSATFTWNGTGADTYLLRYYISGTSNYYYKYSASSPCTLPNLIPNTQYECRISSKIGGQYSSYSTPVSFITIDGLQVVATNLTAQNINSTSATFTWVGSGAETYLLQYYISGTSNYYYKYSTTSPCSLINLIPNTQYECRISSKIDGLYTEYSQPVFFTTINGTQVIATNLAVQNINSTSATFTWDGSGAETYLLQYYISGTSNYYYKYSTTSPCSLINLIPNTQYECRISSKIDGQYNSYSAPVLFTTINGTQVVATNLAVQNINATSATFTWDGSGAETYLLQYYISGTSNYYYKYSTTSPCSLINLIPNTQYECRISSKIDGQYNSYSAPVLFTTINGTQIVATNLAVQNINATSATFTWDGSGAQTYLLKYNIVGNGTFYYKYSSSSPTTLVNLTPNTQYSCRISSKIDGQYTAYSEPVLFTTTSSKSYAFSETNEGHDFIKINAYPNPFTSNLTVSIESSSEEIVIINIIDISGRILYEYESLSNTELNIRNNLNKGIYFIQAINSSGQRAITKVLKTE